MLRGLRRWCFLCAKDCAVLAADNYENRIFPGEATAPLPEISPVRISRYRSNLLKESPAGLRIGLPDDLRILQGRFQTVDAGPQRPGS